MVANSSLELWAQGIWLLVFRTFFHFQRALPSSRFSLSVSPAAPVPRSHSPLPSFSITFSQLKKLSTWALGVFYKPVFFFFKLQHWHHFLTSADTLSQMWYVGIHQQTLIHIKKSQRLQCDIVSQIKCTYYNLLPTKWSLNPSIKEVLFNSLSVITLIKKPLYWHLTDSFGFVLV